MREKFYLNRNWKFSDSFEGSYLIEPMEDGIDVDIPHSFKETSFNYIDTESVRALCAYQRTIFADESWRNKRIILAFDGVAERASVYVNGVNLIIHECGSTPFSTEIGSKLRYGEENLITVLVDSRDSISQPPFVGNNPVDVIPFGGIYRDVYLIVKELVSMDDVFYRPETAIPPDTGGMNRQKLEGYKVPGRLTSSINLSSFAKKMAAEHRLSVRQFLNDTEISYQPLGEDGNTVTATGPVHIWDIDSPICYRVQTDLLLDDMIIDTDVSTIGFRTAVFDQRGFYLNGRRVKIRGIARNQIYPYVGYAMPESIQRYDARILKEELHVNAVRCIGEYPSPHFIEECDTRGLLVFCETPGYRTIGDERFAKTHISNVREMVKEGRNHPSIFLWGTRINGAASSELDSAAVKAAKELDPTRATAGERLEKNMPIAEDVYCYTDLSFSGEGTPLLSKEEVTSDISKPYLVCGYLGESLPVKPADSAKRKVKQIAHAASVLDAQSFLDDVCGSFAICMCDHPTMAENAAEDGVAYHGILDMYRNKKPVANLYASQNNFEPVLAVYPPLSGDRERWEGFGDVYILTNMDKVKVYRDGEYICEYLKEDTHFSHMRHGPILMDDFLGDEIFKDDKNEQYRRLKKLLNQMAVGGLSSFLSSGQMMDRLVSRLMFRMNRKQLLELYEKYVSRAHEYRFEGIKGGKKEIETLIKPAIGKYLRTDVSSQNLIERHGYDVLQIRVMVSNESGEVLPQFAEPLIVNTQGPVRLVGPGIIPLRGGMAGVYIRSIGQEGEAKVTISCGDLVPKEISINIIRAPEVEI